MEYSKPTLELAASSPKLAALAGVESAPCPAQVKTEPRSLPTAEVRVQTMKLTDTAGSVHAIGRVKNARESTIASKVMGTVSQVRVKSGDSVSAGALLVRIDDSDALSASGRLGARSRRPRPRRSSRSRCSIASSA